MTPDKDKSRFELWLDKHNHEMEFIRTITAIIVLILQITILFILS